MSPDYFYWRGTSLFLHIYLKPRASEDKIIGIHDDCLKIRLTAPPVEGRANHHLRKFLAKCFNVPERQVTLLQGERGRKKWVQIDSPMDLRVLTQ